MTAETSRAQPPLIVFSDLDGTLLDHDTYDWQPARPTMERLLQLGGMLVLSSSKTAAEITVLQEAMGIGAAPAIVENGAGIIGLGDPESSQNAYQQIRAALDDLPTPLRRDFAGFGDMSVAEVSAVTGLSEPEAIRAKHRAFSEPGLWHGDETGQAAFLRALAQMGISARSGGRFLTLSHGKTKADAMTQMMTAFAPARTIALGDAPNDIEMLETADTGVIIANPHRPPLPKLNGEATGHIIRSTEPGPTGWNMEMQKLLTTLDLG